MTQEEIEKKAFEVYPVAVYFNDKEHLFPLDANAEKREAYIKALTDLNLDAIRGKAMHEITDRYEALPKIKGWVARDGEGYLTICDTLPKKAKNDEGNLIWDAFSSLDVNTDIFPDLKAEDGPIEVELIIRKI